MLESFEQVEVKSEDLEKVNYANEANKQFKSKIEVEKGVFSNLSSDFDKQIHGWLEIGKSDIEKFNRAFVYEKIKDMFKGVELPNGEKGLGLEEISKRKINPDYAYSNIKQEAGFAAEVISTAKENIVANINSSGIETYRTDDVAKSKPELGFNVNDEYVDKVRIDSEGNVIERIQCKFVGKNPIECLGKLASKDYDKYLSSGKVDKIEIPKDYYDEIKNKLLPEKIESLKKQIDYLSKDGKNDVLKIKNKELEKYQKIDNMIEKSVVSSEESIMAVKHPKIYKVSIIGRNGLEAGKISGLTAAGLTCAISLADNFSKVVNGEMKVDDAVVDTLTKTGKSGIVAFGAGATTEIISQTLQNSGRNAINSIGNSCIPATVVSMAMDSFDSIVDFTNNKINGFEFAEKLGGSAIKVGGGMTGANIGFTLGSTIGGVAGTFIIPGVGTVEGANIGGVTGSIVGGMVGSVVTSCAYSEVSEMVKGNSNINLKELENRAKAMSHNVISLVEQNMPESVNNVKVAFNDFGNSINLPFSLC